MIAKLVVDGEAVPHFSWSGGLLCYKSRIWVGADQTLQLKLIAAFHDSAVVDHSGVLVTYRKIKQLFAWKGLRSAVQDYV
jgi:hypothetical protein